MKQTILGESDALAHEALELLATLESAFAHYQIRIHSLLGRMSRVRQAAQVPDQGGPPISDILGDALVPDVR